MSVLDRRPDAFDERNLFLHALVGLGAASRRLDGLLERYGEAPSPEEALDPEDPVLLALLGVVALKRQVDATLEEARVPEASPPSAPPSLRLRDLGR